MDQLERAAREFRRAETRTTEARTKLRTAILDALREGRTQAEIARVTGYTRERLRQIARDA